MLLGTAITLEESGRKMGWPKASVGAKERAIDAYSEAAAVNSFTTRMPQGSIP